MFSTGFSEGVTSLAALVGALAFLWGVVSIGRRAKTMVAEWRDWKVTIDSAVESKVAAATKPVADRTAEIRDIVASQATALNEINDAVNHKLPHDPTLLQRVKGLEVSHETLLERVGGIETGQSVIHSLLREHIHISRGFQRQVADVVGVPFPEVPEP